MLLSRLGVEGSLSSVESRTAAGGGQDGCVDDRRFGYLNEKRYSVSQAEGISTLALRSQYMTGRETRVSSGLSNGTAAIAQREDTSPWPLLDMIPLARRGCSPTPRSVGGVLTSINTLHSIPIKPTSRNTELFNSCKCFSSYNYRLFVPTHKDTNVRP